MAKDKSTKNTARRPNIHWKVSDLMEHGFAEHLAAAVKRVEETGDDEIVGVYMPQPHQKAWTRLTHQRVSPEALKECAQAIDENPIELTIRRDDEERTLIFTMENVAGTCPPRCS